MYSLPNISVIKYRKIRWAGNIARMKRSANSVVVGKSEEKTRLEDLTVDERIIIKCILKKQNGKVQTACIWLRRLRIGTTGRLV